jgi:hypothetical protein
MLVRPLLLVFSSFLLLGLEKLVLRFALKLIIGVNVSVI